MREATDPVSQATQTDADAFMDDIEMMTPRQLAEYARRLRTGGDDELAECVENLTLIKAIALR
jgi:hypothetical protein